MVIGVYWVLLLIFHWREWKRYFFLFPLYSLFQVMVIVPLGMLKYADMAIRSKNIGLITTRRGKKSANQFKGALAIAK